MNKKLTRCLIGIIFALFFSILPARVLAISLAEQAYQDNNYETLVQVFDQEQIAKKCITNNHMVLGSGNGRVLYSNGKNEYDFQNPSATDILELNNNVISPTYDAFGSTGNTIFSNYLALNNNVENAEQGKYSCIESKENPLKILFSNLQNRFSQYSTDSVGDFLCGRKNDNSGWINMTLEIHDGVWKTYNSAEYSNSGYPIWMNTDANGHFLNCKEARENILKYFNDGFKFGDKFRVIINKNTKFSIDDYFDEALGIKGDGGYNPVVTTSKDKDSIQSGFKNASKYMNFTAGCGVEAVDQQTVNNGGGYKIYYNGQTKYVKVTKRDQKVYTNIDNPNGLICKEVAEALSNSDAGLESNKRAVEICYETAQIGIENINKLIIKLEQYSGNAYSGQLIAAARKVANGDTSNITLSNGNPLDIATATNYGNMIYTDLNNDPQTKNAESAKELGTKAKELGDLAREYYKKIENGESLTTDEKTSLTTKADEFERYTQQFQTNVINKIKEYKTEIPDDITLESAFATKAELASEAGLNLGQFLDIEVPSNGTSDENLVLRTKVENFYTINDNGEVTCHYNDKVQEIAKKIEELGFSVETKEYEQFTESSVITSDSANGDPCYDAGIEGMSWILCPVINNTTNAVDGIEKILRDWLSIDVNQVFIDQTYSAWTTFRDIANGLLVIVLLIIIFSQLTGVGIDNYGIKKMLPKVVVMAILINLSYIICELAVDLSNILGIGLNNLFEAVGQNIRQGAGAGEETLAGIVAGLFGALAGAGAVAGTAITAISIAGGGGVMLVISLILVLLIALVAVLMFFVMLGARMMIVIMFTVIAPVAFLLYILPNTQALFKKWWKVFQAALVVFPICGALYGLSFIIKAIIFNGGEISFILALIAVCAPFMPFLLIPTLLKSALAGLGIIGGALTMMGNGLKRGISSADSSIKNTNTYKEQQNENARRLQERRANRIVDRLNSRRRNGELSTRDQRRLARNYETLDKLTREDNAARTIMAEQEFKGMTESDIQREWEEAFNAGNTQRLDAVTNVLNARYGTGAANWMAKTLAGKNIAGEGEEQKKMQASMRALQDNMAHNNTFANNMKNKASDAYQMISNGGLLGHDENGKDVFANLDHYSKNNAISKDVKDWSTQSADTLRRAISSGALEDDTIRQLLDSTDPAIQSGIQSDKSKRDVLQAHLDRMETNPSGIGPSLPEKEAAQRYRDRQQQVLDQARNTNEQRQQELVDTLREINENLRQHNQDDTFNGDGDGI